MVTSIPPGRRTPVYLGNLQHLGTAESLLNNGMHALEHRDSLVRDAAGGAAAAGPVHDERCVVPSLSCGARPRPGYPQHYCTLRMPGARPRSALPETSMPSIMLGMILGIVMS